MPGTTGLSLHEGSDRRARAAAFAGAFLKARERRDEGIRVTGEGRP